MTRVVWLNGAFVDPDSAALSIDDPGVRRGVGLFETMRGRDGGVPWLDRHLARLTRSAAALDLTGMPGEPAVAAGATAVAEALGAGTSRIRITITPWPTLLVEGTRISLDPDETLTAVSVPGTWHPGRREAEHKTLSFLGWERAQRQAQAGGGDTALLLDSQGRLGEASHANVFCVCDGALITPPIDGILPGIARSVVMEVATVVERHLPDAEWRAADEMFVTNALRGVVPVTSWDGRRATVGATTRHVRQAVERHFGN